MPLRSFIAVDIQDDTIISKIRAIQNVLGSIGADIKMVEPENIHMTLKFLGDVDESLIEQIKRLVLELKFESFKMNLCGIGVFPNSRRPRTIWVGISQGLEPLTQIFNQIEHNMVDLGFKREIRRFNPHITIGRVKGSRNSDQLAKTIYEFTNTCIGEMNIHSIVLKKSVLTSRGPIYSNLAVSCGI